MGQRGEELAVKYLKDKGFQILDRNWSFQKKELDIIAVEGEQLVVVEVKSRSTPEFEHPLDAIDLRKIRNIVHATQAYIDLRDIDLEVRFDVVAVLWKKREEYSIKHIREAFIAPVD